MPNKLQFESSPYLLQHQDNPVCWYPWGEEALHIAQQENKLLFISIGYSACHWCHVMERETFEHDAVAEVLNNHFVSIKVDREERPDVDNLYMLALQLLSGQGGWPLNMICLPDSRPVYGGTYFKPDDFIRILEQLQEKWTQEPDEMRMYADRLTEGIRDANLIPKASSTSEWRLDFLDQASETLITSFDKHEGGFRKAPKFPLPNNWLFLLRYGFLRERQDVVSHVHFTLKKMAQGGIYDHVGGGFARYSVDGRWHIPHFEKMLYDNALLLSLYAEAYVHKPNTDYKNVIWETVSWLKREMQSAEGGFYSALDADSAGVEGAFYTFTVSDFEEALGTDADLFKLYFHVTPEGNWLEENINVLYTDEKSKALVKETGFTPQEWDIYLAGIKEKLLHYRARRERPRLDNKILTAWNGMTIKALADVYRTFGGEDVLEMARKSVQYIEHHLVWEGNKLLRQKVHDGKIVYGFLDDYAFYIEALLALYEVTFEEQWLWKAKDWASIAIDQFYDTEKETFFYVSKQADSLIAPSIDWMDDVIPSSNSTMIRQLAKLGLIFDETPLMALADMQTKNISEHAQAYPSAFSNWLLYIMDEIYGVYEVAITGPESRSMFKELAQHYLPNKVVVGGDQVESNIPLLKGKATTGTKAYVCKNKTCSAPLDTINDLVTLIFQQEQPRG